MTTKQIADILIHADEMKHNNMQKRQINEYLMDIIGQINRELHEAKKLGKYFLIVEIPYIYEIPNMKQQDSQRIIWSRVISIMQSKSYLVKINTNKGKCRLKITWVTPAEQDIIDRQNSILNSCNEEF